MTGGSTKFAIAGVFLLALIGGGAAGLLAARYLAGPVQTVPASNLPLSEALQLSPTQRDQIRDIWLKMQGTSDDCYRQAKSLDQQEHDAIINLLNRDQKEQYEKIHQDYQDKYTANTAKRQAAFDQAVENTKKLLTDSQRRRYEQILTDRMGSGVGQGDARPSGVQSAQTPQ